MRALRKSLVLSFAITIISVSTEDRPTIIEPTTIIPTQTPTNYSTTKYPTHVPSSAPTGSNCVNVPNWVDSYGDDCYWYAQPVADDDVIYNEGDTRCALVGDCCALGGYTAQTACCACGGGSVNGNPFPPPVTAKPTVKFTAVPSVTSMPSTSNAMGTSSPTSSNSPPSNNNNNNQHNILIIAVAGGAGFLFLVMAVGCYMLSKRKRSDHDDDDNHERAMTSITNYKNHHQLKEAAAANVRLFSGSSNSVDDHKLPIGLKKVITTHRSSTTGEVDTKTEYIQIGTDGKGSIKTQREYINLPKM